MTFFFRLRKSNNLEIRIFSLVDSFASFGIIQQEITIYPSFIKGDYGSLDNVTGKGYDI